MTKPLVVILVAGAAAAAAHSAHAASCEGLATTALPNTSITAAQTVAAGAFTPPAPSGRGAAQLAESAKKLPAFCRVMATLKPSSDSDIKIEVWMPSSGWNGKFQAVGNGGWTGSINYQAMAEALGRGYATSSTDTGHTGGSASFAIGHPEKVIDFGYRSEHEMTIAAKALVAAFYSKPPAHSYWNGCSAGGRQALKEAQMFPGDYDGIIAGAPASDWTGRAAQSLRIAQTVHREEGSYIQPEKYRVLHDAVLQACDALDGTKDGLIEDPTRCHFDPKVLECKDSDGPTCLTTAQVETARAIYSSATNPKSHREITGLQPGSELGWATWGGPQPLAISFDHFRYLVFKDPNWDYRTFNFETDIARAEQMDGGTINALDPNLKPFFDRGGKLLQYHGWSDPQISPGSSVQYYTSVTKALGAPDRIGASYRLFMVPGMAHCGGGEGPNVFDTVSALERWVEQGQAPEQIIASRIVVGQIGRTRPLCPYPQKAVYKGSGSIDDATNFSCR